MKTCAVFFPFDLFGSGGAGAGVDLLVDAASAAVVGNHLQGKGLAYVLNGVARITEAGRLFVERTRARQA